MQKSLAPDLSGFGSRVLEPRLLALTADAERNQPQVQTWDAFGHRVDKLLTSEGWRKLSAIGIAEGIVAIPYEAEYGPYSRVYQFLKYHLWSGSSAIVTCPSAMTDGAAKLLARQLSRGESSQSLSEAERQVFKDAYRRLVSRDPEVAWTSGQWMTERPGGSDVRNTETLAKPSTASASDTAEDTNGQPLGPWSIDGFKWFSSATDSQMSVLLAKMPDTKNISAFYVPTRRRAPQAPEGTELNGIQIQRMKQKLGTRSLPTAELVLSDMRAYLLGAPGTGVKEISTILNITRMHNTISAVGFWGRGLAISRAFSRVRSTSGKLLIDTPAHTRTLAEQHVGYRAMMHLAFFAAALLGITESSSGSGPGGKAAAFAHLPDTFNSYHLLLRLITPVAKASTARATIAGLAECMESLGGVGYLENDNVELNIARLYRDANVLSIWEGTTNVMADDVVRVVKSRDGDAVIHALAEWITATTAHLQDEAVLQTLRGATASLIEYIRLSSTENLKLNGRVLISRLGWLICGTLLAADAARDGDGVAKEVLRRWLERKEKPLYGYGSMEDDTELSGESRVKDASGEGVLWDRKIVFGDDPEEMGRAKL